MPRGVTPLLATHRAVFGFTAQTLAHKLQIHANAQASTTPSGYAFITRGGGLLDADVAANALATLFAGVLHTSATIQQFVLQQYSGGAYIPVHALGLSVTGIQSNPGSTASQMTATYRDGSYHLIKVVALGVAATAPAKGSIASIPSGSFKDFLLSFVDTTYTNGPAYWAVGRSGLFFETALNSVIDLNRKSRRRLALV